MSDTVKSKSESNHITLRACGPIRAMIANELRGHQNRTAIIEDCIAEALRTKYPKLYERFKILREEAA